MTEEIVAAMAPPEKNGRPTLPRRSAPKGLLPSSWLGHSVRLEYESGFGAATEATGVLLDTYPAGLVLSLAGAKTLLPWERLTLLELVEG